MKWVKNNEKGATTVEFAVIAVLLFFILFSILEFGFIFMQEHYVANAAREGVRIGIRANNYTCFNNTPAAGCSPATDRQAKVVGAVREYLSPLYDLADIIKPVARTADVTSENPDPDHKVLTVTVEVNNFFPPIISALAALIPGGGFQLPATIAYTAKGEYEDPNED